VTKWLLEAAEVVRLDERELLLEAGKAGVVEWVGGGSAHLVVAGVCIRAHDVSWMCESITPGTSLARPAT